MKSESSIPRSSMEFPLSRSAQRFYAKRIMAQGGEEARTREDCAAEIAGQAKVLDVVMVRFCFKAACYRAKSKAQRNEERAVELDTLALNILEVMEELRAEYSALTGDDLCLPDWEVQA